MINNTIYIVFFSLLFQLTSAILALRLIKVTGKRLSWILIAIAFIIMAIRRAIPFYHGLVDNSYTTLDPIFEILGLILSFFLMIGISTIKPFFLSIKKSQENLNSIAKFPIENPNPVLRVSTKGFLLFHNVASKFLLDDWRIQLNQQIPEAWKNMIEKSIRSKQNCIYEVVTEKKFYAFYICPITNTDYVNIYGIDITEMKKSKEEEIKQKLKYQQLVETLHEGIWVLDTKSITTYVNPMMANLLGFSVDEMIGKHLFSFMKEDQIEICKTMLLRRHKGIKEQHEFKFLKKDGTEIIAYLDASPLYNEKGVVIGCIAGVLDITEKRKNEVIIKQQEKNFVQMQKLESIGKLTGGIAHDFNNFLTVISGCVNLISNNEPIEKNLYKEYLEEINNAVNKASQLTKQLLIFSRKENPKFYSVDLNEIIMNFEKILERLIGENFTVNLSLNKDLPRINADQNQIEQIIMNLAINARDAMPKGGTIQIRTEKPHLTIEEKNINHCSDCCRNYKIFSECKKNQDFCSDCCQCIQITIADTGVGISKENISHIFEPFFTTKPTGEGTGLGLSVVYTIVKSHNGKIWVESELGKGTKFRILLPISQNSIQCKQTKIIEENVHNLPKRILIVEDDENVRLITRKMLQKYNYTVFEAENAIDALKLDKIILSQLDLGIFDVVMPHMNGKELAQELLKKYPALKILFISGYPFTQKDPLSQNSINFIQKPFNSEVLLKQINNIFRN